MKAQSLGVGVDFEKRSIRDWLSLVVKLFGQQYLLLLLLQYPFRWMRWIPLVAIGLLGVGLLLVFAKKQLGWIAPEWVYFVGDITFPISAVALMLSLISVCFLLPSQAVHLVTSKQNVLLESFRAALYWHIHLVALSYSLLIAFAWSFKSGELGSVVKIFLLTHFLISNFIHISIYGSQKTLVWPFFLGFSVPFYQYIAMQLHGLNSIWLLLATLTSWAIFSVWWVKWKPKQHRVAMFAESFTDPARLQRLQSGINQGAFGWLTFGLNKNIENLFDGLLLGRAKEPFGVALVALSVPVIMILGMLPAFILLPNLSIHKFGELVRSGSVLFILIIMAIPTIQHMVVFHNIKKVWLCYSGARRDFFSVFERLLLTQAGFQILVIASVLLIVVCAVESLRAWLSICVISIFVGINIAILEVYLCMLLFQMAKGSRAVQGSISMVVILLFAVPFGIFAQIQGERLLSEFSGLLAGFCSALVATTGILRSIAKQKWQKIEFVRMR